MARASHVTFQCGMEVIRDSFAVPPNTGNSISRPPIIGILIEVMRTKVYFL